MLLGEEKTKYIIFSSVITNIISFLLYLKT